MNRLAGGWVSLDFAFVRIVVVFVPTTRSKRPDDSQNLLGFLFRECHINTVRIWTAFFFDSPRLVVHHVHLDPLRPGRIESSHCFDGICGSPENGSWQAPFRSCYLGATRGSPVPAWCYWNTLPPSMIEDLETDIGDHHGSCLRCGESKVRTNLASRGAKEKVVVQCGPLIFVHEREVFPQLACVIFHRGSNFVLRQSPSRSKSKEVKRGLGRRPTFNVLMPQAKYLRLAWPATGTFKPL